MSIGTRVLGGLLVNSLTAKVRAPSGSSNQCVGAGSGCLGGGQRGLGSSAGPTVSTLGGLMNLNSKKEGERGGGRTKVLSLHDLEACSQDQSKKNPGSFFLLCHRFGLSILLSLSGERGRKGIETRARGEGGHQYQLMDPASGQAALPAGLKHIIKRRKRNQQGSPQ